MGARLPGRRGSGCGEKKGRGSMIIVKRVVLGAGYYLYVLYFLI